jgi:hypothetical protein
VSTLVCLVALVASGRAAGLRLLVPDRREDLHDEGDVDRLNRLASMRKLHLLDPHEYGRLQTSCFDPSQILDVLDLAYYPESVDEIAAIVWLPTSTVKTRIFYARSRMQRSLSLAGIDVV